MIHLLVFLLLGAIVNVAVAWAFAITWGSDREVRSRILLPGFDQYRPLVNFSPAERQLFSDAAWTDRIRGDETCAGARQRVFRGWRETTYHAGRKMVIPKHAGHAETTGYALTNLPVVVQVFAGWPCESLHATRFETVAGTSHAQSWELPPLFGLFPNSTGYSTPTGLLWPGFAINTVFYAFILWLLFATPFALRRRRRIKRGLCPKCAYPVGTNERCTECGTAVTCPPSSP